MTKTRTARASRSSVSRQVGFSLIELLVSMAVFMTISGAALSLFRQQQLSLQDLGGRTGLNLGLRSAASQLQMDLANAGSGYFQGINMPSWPIGVTMTNRVVAPGNSCYNAGTLTYGANCFDTLNIISADVNTPPAHTTDSGNTGGCSDTSTGAAYLKSATLAATAANFHRNDQVLFITNTTSATQMTSVVLSGDASVVNGVVKLPFNATTATVGAIAGGANSLANDPLDITACNNNQANCSLTVTDTSHGITPKLTNKFCSSDWAIKLAPVIYTVDNTNPQDPVLMRQVGIGGAKVPVMDQVIGFKVGATIWNGNTGGLSSGTESSQYFYDASTFTDSRGSESYNFSLVRSIRVSLIGRTTPDYRGTYKFRNTFDNGPYQVQGVAVVANPRNLSMNDQ